MRLASHDTSSDAFQKQSILFQILVISITVMLFNSKLNIKKGAYTIQNMLSKLHYFVLFNALLTKACFLVF